MRPGDPLDLVGGIRPATCGVMVKQHVGLLERGVFPGKTAIEQNGWGVAPTVVAKVTYCVPLKVASQLAPGIQHAGVGSKVNFAPRRI